MREFNKIEANRAYQREDKSRTIKIGGRVTGKPYYWSICGDRYDELGRYVFVWRDGSAETLDDNWRNLVHQVENN